jgi:iron-sulfur cluster repair protein YtfE (RIC family)
MSHGEGTHWQVEQALAREWEQLVEREPSFLVLCRVHERVNELFLQHQEALVESDIARARHRLALYERELLAHMEPEEELLLPVYARAGAIPGGPLELFLGEHRKMREFLERFHATLLELEAHPPDLRRRILQLLDEQAMFKHLVEHHDLRERNILYPALDRVTTDEERRALLRRCLFSQPAKRAFEMSLGRVRKDEP